MKKLFCLIVLMLATATAQKMPSPMPVDSPQYKATQQTLSALHGYERECSSVLEILNESLQETYKVYETVCGVYFVSSHPPLETIDFALSEYKSMSARQNESEDSYSRDFELSLGNFRVSLNEHPPSDKGFIRFIYSKAKPIRR